MATVQVSPPKEQTETRPRRYIGYGDNFRYNLTQPDSHAAELMLVSFVCSSCLSIELSCAWLQLGVSLGG